MSAVLKILAKSWGRSRIILRSSIAARARRAVRNAQGIPSLILYSKRFSSDTPATPGDCPFKSLADIPGEWEEFPFGGDHSKQYNPSGMYKYSLFGQKTVGVYSANGTRDVLKLDSDGTGKTNWPPQIRALLGESSFTLKYGQDHRRIRRILNPLFTESAIAARYDIVWRVTDTFLNSLFTKTQECKQGEYVDLHSITRQWAWDIAVGVVLGAEDPILTKDENETMCSVFFVWTLGFLDPDITNKDQPGTLLGNGMVARKQLLEFIDTIIERGRALGDDLDRDSALYGMLRADWSADELREGLLNLMFAAHDTTATSTNNVVLAMYKHPLITDKLSETLKGLKKDENGKLDYSELMECSYLDGFVREALRMTPGLRGVTKAPMEDTIINGIPIPKGQDMYVDIELQSMNADEFENPQEFDPTRWMNGNGPSKYGFTPFGMGSKICLGWRLVYVEMKLMVALFQSRVRMEIDEERIQKAMSPFNYWEIYGRFHPK